MLEFLKVWGCIAVEGKHAVDVQNDLRARYRTLKRRIYDHLGDLGEIYMAQVLWNGQNRSLPGIYLHWPEDIAVNWHFSFIRHRVRLGASADKEVDVYAGAGIEVWLCECKWWRGRKVGRAAVTALLEKGDLVRADMADRLETLRLWIFAYDGFTLEAEKLMREKGVLWSDRADLDQLLNHVGLKRLPEVGDQENEATM